ncbi:hypothetical protein [Polaromonas sp. YR568]|uniref:hypothetical protein n=1 Tax=Polaromonas sp. YR568 TaxID=1855301 RepID=UPI00398BD331
MRRAKRLRAASYFQRSSINSHAAKENRHATQRRQICLERQTKRKAEHIEEGYEDRGVGKKEAESRAWATVNKESGGGEKSGSGRGKAENHSSSRKGGRAGGAAAASRTPAERSASAKKAAATRKRNAASGK